MAPSIGSDGAAGLQTRIRIRGGYKDIYSPMTLKCKLEFVLVPFCSCCALTNKQNIINSHV